VRTIHRYEAISDRAVREEVEKYYRDGHGRQAVKAAVETLMDMSRR
jgi:hypothetical protein